MQDTEECDSEVRLHDSVEKVKNIGGKMGFKCCWPVISCFPFLWHLKKPLLVYDSQWKGRFFCLRNV